MPMYDFECQCPTCQHTFERLVPLGEMPRCPECGNATEKVWMSKPPADIPDEIPGGYEVKHGICNKDGSPRRYYSKSEMAAEAKRRGLVNYVRHQTEGTGSDKSKHTSRWI